LGTKYHGLCPWASIPPLAAFPIIFISLTAAVMMRLTRQTTRIAIDCHCGFWAYADSTGNVSAEGAPNTSIFLLNLNYGWNFLAVPFFAAKQFGELNLSHGFQQSLAEGSSLTIPPEADKWVYGRMYNYTGGFWHQQKTSEEANFMQNAVGYWLWCWNDSGETTLNFPPPPVINNINPASGEVGTIVTLEGANFGATQGSSIVTFGGTPATDIPSWNATQILAGVPQGAGSGPVVVTVGGVPSNSDKIFTVQRNWQKDLSCRLIQDIWGSSATDIYASGWYGTVIHYNGSSWSALTTNINEHLWGIWGSSAADVRAVGNSGVMLRY
jgi:hypothetical protein